MTSAPRTPRDLRVWAAARTRRRPEIWLGSPDLGDADESTFSLRPPTREAVRTDPDAAHRWLAAWRDFPAGRGVEVQREQRDWRPFGVVSVPIRVRIVGSDALANLATLTSWPDTRGVAQVLREHWPGSDYLADALVARRGSLAGLDHANLARLIDVVDWLVAHPESGLLPRQVPVPGVDSKWIERHRGLVESFVAAVSGAPDSGLVHEAQRFRVRLLDPTMPSEVRDFTAPIAELSRATWTPKTVVIVENLATLAVLPELPGVVAIHGRGLAAEQLGRVPWIADCARVLYWGDLDSWGFLCLSRCRRSVPHAESALMDAATLRQFWSLVGTEPVSYRAPIESLTASESETLELLRVDQLRLEQEHIELNYAVAALRRRLAAQM